MSYKPEPFIDPASLYNPVGAVQQQIGSGRLTITNFKLDFDSDKYNINIKRKFVMPMFLHLQFRADWLCSKPLSSEKRITGVENNHVPSKEWLAH